MKLAHSILFALLFGLGCGKSEAPPPPPLPPAAPVPSATPAPTPAEATAQAFAGFEGEITLKVRSSGAKENAAVVVSVKASKVRFALPRGLESGQSLGERAHLIVHTADKKLMAVSDEKQQVFLVNLEQLGEQMKGFAPPSAEAAKEEAKPPQVKKTGHTDTVAGYSCEDWEVVTSEGEKAHLCVANQGASWFELPTIGLPSEHGWARELFDGHHLPLRVITFGDDGQERMRIEVSKLEKKSLADALFEPPATYKVIDVASMMQNAAAAAQAAGIKMPMMPGGKPGQVPPHVKEMMEKMRARMKERQSAGSK